MDEDSERRCLSRRYTQPDPQQVQYQQVLAKNTGLGSMFWQDLGLMTETEFQEWLQEAGKIDFADRMLLKRLRGAAKLEFS